MNISDFGAFTIQASPSKSKPGVLEIAMACESRQLVIRGETRVGESVNDFAKRIVSNMRTLHNAPLRPAPETAKPSTKPPTWDDTKAALKQEKGA